MAKVISECAVLSPKLSYNVGDNVYVKPRTSPGINKQGGYGRVSKINEDDGTYSVKYFLGGGERCLEASLLSVYEPLSSRKRKGNEDENRPSLSPGGGGDQVEKQSHVQRMKYRQKVECDDNTITTEDHTDGGSKPLRDRWGIRRTYTTGDCWLQAQAALASDGTMLLNRDVGHTGCCKGYSLATLLRPEFDGRGVPPDDEGPAPSRLALDTHVRAWRAVLADALTEEELRHLRSDGATNRSDWRRFTSLEEAKTRVALSYDAARKIGHSMSPVWLEEWETSVICRHESERMVHYAGGASSTTSTSSMEISASPMRGPFLCGCKEGASCVICKGKSLAFSRGTHESRVQRFQQAPLSKALVIVEIHDGSPSKANRSCFQIVLPYPDHKISCTDTVIILRRIQCHYNPCWLNGKPRNTVAELPKSFRCFFGFETA